MVETRRSRHDSRRTEAAYLYWIRRFLEFHNSTHPRELADKDFNRFLTHLALSEKVAASTQNQALAAVLFFYQHILDQPLDRIEGVVRARKPKRLPVVLTRKEFQAILAELDATPAAGMRAALRRWAEAARRARPVRQRSGIRPPGDHDPAGQGQRDRVTMLPGPILQALEDHLRRVRQQHEADLKSGLGQAPLPDALARKYPNADREGPVNGYSHFLAGIRLQE